MGWDDSTVNQYIRPVIHESGAPVDRFAVLCYGTILYADDVTICQLSVYYPNLNQPIGSALSHLLHGSTSILVTSIWGDLFKAEGGCGGGVYLCVYMCFVWMTIWGWTEGMEGVCTNNVCVWVGVQ